MRIPLLVLCLAVIYGACTVYSEKIPSIHLDYNVPDDTDDADNTDLYAQGYAIVPLGNSLSRHKRASLLTPVSLITDLITNIIGSSFHILSKAVINIICFISRTVIQKISICPNAGKLSLQQIIKSIMVPTEAVRTILCQIFYQIRTNGCKIIYSFLHCVWEFLRKVVMPGIYEQLNKPNNGNIPSCVKPFIIPFNLLYTVLAISKFVPMMNFPNIPIAPISIL